jgi:hypothetical protein
MESLTQFFNDIGRIAAALETLALLHGEDPAEHITGDVAYKPVVGSFASTQAGEAERQKRKRRTKAEIAADEAAKNAAENAPFSPSFPPITGFSAPVVPAPVVPAPVVPAPVVPAPVVPAPVVPAPAVPAPVVPAPVVPAPVVPAPVVPAPAQPDMSVFAAQYASLSVQQQFSALLDVYAKHANVMGVIDALQRSLAALGLAGEKLSDMLDSSAPGEKYKALSSDQRWSIYQQVFSAATAAAHTM